MLRLSRCFRLIGKTDFMKTRLLVIIAVIFFISCSKRTTDNSEYERSYKTFLQFKAASGNSYKYVVTTSSWTGFSTETIITIQNGEATKREYKSMQLEHGSNPPVTTVVEQWVEDKAGLNSHEAGADPVTLDVVYSKAKNEWLKVDPNSNTIFFEIENKGMISLCGYVPKNCADDCFMGIVIKNISAIN